jgi:uncharacterized protein
MVQSRAGVGTIQSCSRIQPHQRLKSCSRATRGGRSTASRRATWHAESATVPASDVRARSPEAESSTGRYDEVDLSPVYATHILRRMADLHARVAEATGFEWDAGNATKNWTKHTVSQSECEQVFFSAPLVLATDPEHSADEPRYFALGHTDEGRLLLVVFTLRDTLIRVISARPMSRREREVYHDAEAREDVE